MATMTTRSTVAQRTITIPAAYLDDFRTAAVALLAQDTQNIRRLQTEIGEDDGAHDQLRRLDVSASVPRLKDDVNLLDQVRDADGETTATADADTLSSALQLMVPMLAIRIAKRGDYYPLLVDDLPNEIKEVEWAADSLLEIDPFYAEEAMA